jgi:predicted N-acetyltransferase YhbS
MKGMYEVIALLPLETVDPQAVETHLDRAFGPGRRARTAYKVRLGTSAIPELSFAAVADDGGLLGSIQCWPVTLECDGGGSVAMVMVGPVAVQPDRQQGGIGRMLMERMLEAAKGSALPGADALVLIGDPEYYGRFFSFTADGTGGWRLPGPFEARRLLARGVGIPTGPGVVGARLRRAA